LRIQLDEIGSDVRWSDGVVINAPVWNARRTNEKDSAKAAAQKL
jgi:hypothetical protein